MRAYLYLAADLLKLVLFLAVACGLVVLANELLN